MQPNRDVTAVTAMTAVTAVVWARGRPEPAPSRDRRAAVAAVTGALPGGRVEGPTRGPESGEAEGGGPGCRCERGWASAIRDGPVEGGRAACPRASRAPARTNPKRARVLTSARPFQPSRARASGSTSPDLPLPSRRRSGRAWRACLSCGFGGGLGGLKSASHFPRGIADSCRGSYDESPEG